MFDLRGPSLNLVDLDSNLSTKVDNPSDVKYASNVHERDNIRVFVGAARPLQIFMDSVLVGESEQKIAGHQCNNGWAKNSSLSYSSDKYVYYLTKERKIMRLTWSHLKIGYCDSVEEVCSSVVYFCGSAEKIAVLKKNGEFSIIHDDVGQDWRNMEKVKPAQYTCIQAVGDKFLLMGTSTINKGVIVVLTNDLKTYLSSIELDLTANPRTLLNNRGSELMYAEMILKSKTNTFVVLVERDGIAHLATVNQGGTIKIVQSFDPVPSSVPSDKKVIHAITKTSDRKTFIIAGFGWLRSVTFKFN